MPLLTNSPTPSATCFLVHSDFIETPNSPGEIRRSEIGVRIALGATTTNVLKLVLKQAVRTALIGVSVGLVASLILTRTMRSLLFEVSPADPLTLTAVAILLLLLAMLASYIPARRATRVDPIVALRYE
jgi:putative ABC transport system permease protein